jgi:hypothetical protein
MNVYNEESASGKTVVFTGVGGDPVFGVPKVPR